MRTWRATSNSVIVLAVDTETDLATFVERLAAHHIEHTAVFEPDLNNELTAVALTPGPQTARMCASLPLAGRTQPAVAAARVRELQLTTAARAQEVHM